MTLLTITLLSFLSLVTSHPGGYWWMGQEGAFQSQTNNKISDNSPSPSLQIPAGTDEGGTGYYGSSTDYDEDLSPSPPAGSEADLPVTECPLGWKCVSELFCDATATMVPQRVQLSKAEIARRGDLIVSFLCDDEASINSLLAAMYEPGHRPLQCLLQTASPDT